jgi:ABC-type lipoprotein release transport system permease subunit
MYYLIPIPLVFIAAIVFVVSDKYKLKIFRFISKLTIIVCVIAFIYMYAAYNGFDLLEYIKIFLEYGF